MGDAASMSEIAGLIADPTRAEMLLTMMDGRAFPASELALVARVSAPTASYHLKLLTDSGLVEVFQAGRHRYHRLAGPAVAGLLEQLGGVGTRPRLSGSRAALAEGRSCYDHLAGRLGVRIRVGLESRGFISLDGDRYLITGPGREFFFGIWVIVPPHPTINHEN